MLTTSISGLLFALAFYIKSFFFLSAGLGFLSPYSTCMLSHYIPILLRLSDDSSVIPTEKPQYIMEDELSPPKSNHKEESNLYKATML